MYNICTKLFCFNSTNISSDLTVNIEIQDLSWENTISCHARCVVLFP